MSDGAGAKAQDVCPHEPPPLQLKRGAMLVLYTVLLCMLPRYECIFVRDLFWFR
jgi:hypothetical protein